MSDDLLKKNDFLNYEEKVDRKLDRIEERLDNISVTLAENTSSLKEHMRRSDLLEEADKKIVEELKPIKIHVSQVDGIFKFVGVVSAILSIILGVLKLSGKV